MFIVTPSLLHLIGTSIKAISSSRNRNRLVGYHILENDVELCIVCSMAITCQVSDLFVVQDDINGSVRFRDHTRIYLATAMEASLAVLKIPMSISLNDTLLIRELCE
jgi:hypothetical protein